MPNNKRSRDDNGGDDEPVLVESVEPSYLHPRQPEQERRVIRRQYRQYIEGLHRDKHDLINPSSDSLNERLQEVDEMFPQVQEGPEAALDSQALAIVANLGKQKAQALHTTFIKFDSIEFAEKMVTFMGGRVDQGTQISSAGWVRLGEAVQPFFRRAPPFHFMAGSFERGEVNLIRKTLQAPKAKPTNETETETKFKELKHFAQTGEENEATTAEVERVETILRDSFRKADHSPICYFEFVINPDSFGQTVENIFYTSFLVKDNLARIYLDDDGLPVIEPVDTKEGEGEKPRIQRQHQTIMSITPAEWRELIETFQIHDIPIIPTRKLPNNSEHGNSKKLRAMKHLK